MTDTPPTEILLKGAAYVHKANPGQTVEFSKSGSKYVIQPNGALKRAVPKLSKKVMRNQRREQRRMKRQTQ